MGNANGREEMEDEDEDPSVRSKTTADPDSVHTRRIRSASSISASPPESPGRSRSPLMFAPEMPVPPLQGAAEAASVFNQLWMDDSDQSLDGPAEKGVPTLLTWNRGGNSVLVEGSWDNWKCRSSLHRSGKDHSILLVLPSGIYQYKFIVDGKLRHLPDLPSISDDSGNIINILDVHEYVPENIESVSEFESPPSPESSYAWSLPSDEDFAKEPPGHCSQLHLTILDIKNNAEEASPKPQHTVLNHLFIEKGYASQSMVALGLTHRFMSKYVTVVLYKPVGR